MSSIIIILSVMTVQNSTSTQASPPLDVAQFWSNVAVAVFTGVLTLVAVLTLLGQIRGPKIVLILADYREVPTRQPTTLTNPPLTEFMQLGFPVIFSNVGPRGGAITDVEIVMLQPPSTLPSGSIPTARSRVPNPSTYDKLKMTWRMGEVSYNPPIFVSGRPAVMTIRNNESIGLMAQLDFYLTEQSTTVMPTATLMEVQNKYPVFKFKLRYKEPKGTKKFVQHEQDFEVRPLFVP